MFYMVHYKLSAVWRKKTTTIKLCPLDDSTCHPPSRAANVSIKLLSGRASGIQREGDGRAGGLERVIGREC